MLEPVFQFPALVNYVMGVEVEPGYTIQDNACVILQPSCGGSL